MNLNVFNKIRRIWGGFEARFCEIYEIRRIWGDFLSASHFKKTLFCGVALYLIALFALLRGDIYYADDLNRAISDYGGNYYNRYFTEFILTRALTFGKGTLDMSPLPQILGVIFIVLSSMILIHLIRKKIDFIGILASLPLGLSPHFLQNLSYKFDALTMSIALFLAILPFLFQHQRRVFCALSVLCLLLMFMTYQAANASYIILSLYFALFVERRDFKQGTKFLGICALNFIIASLIYKLTINPAITGDKMFAFNALFAGILRNLATYFATIFSDLKNTPFIYLIALNCALFIANAESSADSAKSHKILRFLSIASIALTAYFLISFANIYGNALKKQDEFLSFRAKMLLQDLGEKIPRGASVVVDIGAMGNAVVTQRFYEKYGDARIIPRLSARGDFWFEMKLRHLGAPYNFGDAEICDTLKAQFGSEVVAENAHHKIEKAKVCYVVSLK